MIWSEDGIHKIVRNVLSSGFLADEVKRQLRAALEGGLDDDIRNNVQEISLQLTQVYKTSIHRKLNSIHSDYCAKLDLDAKRFVETIEHGGVRPTERLKELNAEVENLRESLNKTISVLQHRLEECLREPDQHLKSKLKQLEVDVTKITNDSIIQLEQKLLETGRSISQRLNKIIDSTLHSIIVDAVSEQFQSSVTHEALISNKQQAALLGVSLREVKRRKRRNVRTAPPELKELIESLRTDAGRRST